MAGGLKSAIMTAPKPASAGCSILTSCCYTQPSCQAKPLRHACALPPSSLTSKDAASTTSPQHRFHQR